MGRFAEAPVGFRCPYKDHCPHAEGLSTRFLFHQYHRGLERERLAEASRLRMAGEINALMAEVRNLEAENDRLRAENRRLHQKDFKPSPAPKKPASASVPSPDESPAPRPRGAPAGHPPWTRETPGHVDQTVEIEAPAVCPHCAGETDPSIQGESRFVQEDIVLCPRTVVTEFIHKTAWCPACRRGVRHVPEGELPDAPIGPNAKAAAMYLRHELKLPYRKIQGLMSAFFGISFVPASTLGFEKKASANAEGAHEDLVRKARTSPCLHADETHWREDGQNRHVFFAGDGNVAVFHIDPSRSTEAAKVLLGEQLDGVLVTDAYAGYNGIEVLARQSCLAHLVRKAAEVEQEILGMKTPDPPSLRFCANIRKLFSLVCRLNVPADRGERDALAQRLLRSLDLFCEKPLAHPKAETLRKRFLPGARERDEVFTCVRHATPPTNNLAERALRPLVIFRKVCMGSRSEAGSKNIAVFSSILQTGKLQSADLIEILRQLLVGSPEQVHSAIFPGPD